MNIGRVFRNAQNVFSLGRTLLIITWIVGIVLLILSYYQTKPFPNGFDIIFVTLCSYVLGSKVAGYVKEVKSTVQDKVEQMKAKASE